MYVVLVSTPEPRFVLRTRTCTGNRVPRFVASLVLEFQHTYLASKIFLLEVHIRCLTEMFLSSITH